MPSRITVRGEPLTYRAESTCPRSQSAARSPRAGMTRLSMAAIEFLMPLTSDLTVHKETSSFLICSISDDGIIALVGHKNLKTANITVSKKMPEARLNMRITTSRSANNLSDEKMYAMEIL